MLAMVAVLLAAALRDAAPRRGGRKDKRPVTRQALAAHYVGMSEADLVKELGPPKRVLRVESRDAGPYRELIYSEAKWAETDFAIYDGIVSDGEINGVSFETPGFEIAAKHCADLWPTDTDRWTACVKPYRAKPRESGQNLVPRDQRNAQ